MVEKKCLPIASLIVRAVRQSSALTKSRKPNSVVDVGGRFRNLLVSVCLCALQASGQWTPTIQINHGDNADSHPSFANTYGWNFSAGEQEWLAFTRVTPTGKRICLMQSTPQGISWIDSVYFITGDGEAHDYPSFAISRFSPPASKMLVVWEKGTGTHDIFYSRNEGSGWSSPDSLFAGPNDDRSPDVAADPDGFSLVWERNGRIMYSELDSTVWSSPLLVSQEGDSLNFRPRVTTMTYGSTPIIMVAWEKMKLPDSSRAIMYAVRSGAGWASPNTINWNGDNRNPRFFKSIIWGPMSIAWESNQNGYWGVYASAAYYDGAALNWFMRNQPGDPNPNADVHQPSFLWLPIITAPGTPLVYFPYDAGTWRVVSVTGDSIALSAHHYVEYRTGGAGSINRNPDLSSGVSTYTPRFGFRVWSVWENNSSGVWKLYGSSVFILLDDVRDGHSVVDRFQLYQNYPNPFNPSTTIGYELAQASFVTVTVYNALGQEVAQLVHEQQGAGVHNTVFHGNGMASGVYFYRLQAGEFVEMRKLVLVR